MSTQGHPAAPLLQELADEAKVNAEPWRAFEFWSDSSDKWLVFTTISTLMSAMRNGREIRRRPKTVRVCGEVPEEVIEAAKRGAKGDIHYRFGDLDMVSRALLSLVEESER